VGAKHQPSATIGDKVMLQQKLSVHALGEVWGKAVIALRTEMAQPTLHS
jgi:hypothetical protein